MTGRIMVQAHANCLVDDSAMATGCPIDPAAMARYFDPFEGPYQIDPAETLRWSRDQMPVFYSTELGYWIVSKYDDVKAVFRDNILFSPKNVLEKISPATAEA